MTTVVKIKLVHNYNNFFVKQVMCITYLSPRLLVSLLVEISKEEVKHKSMESNPPDEGLGVVTVNEKKLESMYHN